MRNAILIFYILNCGLLFGQNASNVLPNPEGTPDSLIFESYLDSLAKYLYKDSKISMDYMEKCESMIQEKKELSINNQFRFVIESIYVKYLDDDAIGALEIIENNRELSNLSGVDKGLKKSFLYLSGFTSMSLADYESAQKVSFQLLEEAEAEQDTNVQIQAAHMLGTIYEEQSSYENAIKYYSTAYSISHRSLNNKIHTAYYLVRTYIRIEEKEKANKINTEALHLADSLDYLVFKFDLLRQKIDLLLMDNRIDEAYDYLEQTIEVANELDNETHLAKCMESKASILRAQKKPAVALKIYDDLIKAELKNIVSPSDLIRYYSAAHVLAQSSKDSDKAYDYLRELNEIQDSLDLQEKEQQVELLNIKFEVEQKEKDNQILTAQVAQKRSQNNLLTALAASFALLVIGMYISVNQKRKYSKQLEQKVAKRTAELEQTNGLLKKSNNELSQFNKILYHDLKEPIRSIVGFSYLAKENLENGKYNELPNQLSIVEESGRKLNQLVEDVNLYQINSEQVDQKIRLVNVPDILKNVEQDLTQLIAAKNAQIRSNRLPQVVINEPLLQLCLKHLVENGLKFNDSEVPTVDVDYELTDDYHRFIISDNGIGIPDEYRKNIFMMFSRLDNTKIHNGSGLGLSLIKKLLENNDSIIRLHNSIPGVGSTFHLEFPIIEQGSLLQ